MSKLENYILELKPVQFLILQSKRIILPGFDKVPLYDVVVFFFSQVKKVGVSDRAAAISFNFIMSIPAGAIFLFTLIPFFPISTQITGELLILTRTFAPNENTYMVVSEFLNDFLETPRSGLLSLGFILAVFYASNAVMQIMRSFNRSLIQYNKRSFIHERWVAIRLTTILILLFIVTNVLLITQGNLFRWLMDWLDIKSRLIIWIIDSTRWVIIFALVFYTIGFIYKYAPAISKRWKLASPGTILATFLIVVAFFLFSFWVNNFGSYNKVYGSIGTILIIMLLIYISSMILLIGYELNVSIHSLKALADERQLHEKKAAE